MAHQKKHKKPDSNSIKEVNKSLPAPIKDRIKGSKVNKPMSASSKSSGVLIVFSEPTIKAIKNKIKIHNQNYPSKKVNLATAKSVVRRGMGAYSVSHRPTISFGQPNSRVAWGLARLDAFLKKKVNKNNNKRYVQDDDLL